MQVISGVAGIGLKWPNDLLWQRRKLGGLLLEVAAEAQGPSLVVVGLWVQAPRPSLLQLAPFFYGAPSAQQNARVLDHFAQAGFHAHLTWRATPRGKVAIVIATLSAVQP